MYELPDVQENNEQILTDIQSLQTMEQQLFSSLESDPSLSSQQQQQIINRMNKLSDMRINLYKTLSGVNNFYQNALSSSQITLSQQTIAVSIVEEELNHAKERLKMLQEDKANKLRLVEINYYYGEKYSEHSTLMKIVILTLLPILILAVLHNRGFIPGTVYYILIGIISFIGAILFWYVFSSIVTRDNMNYQEYDWTFDPASAPSGTSTGTDPWGNNGLLGTCIGQSCCSSGQIYDASLNQCIGDSTVVPSTSTSTTSTSASGTSTSASGTSTTETFVNQVLTKKSNNFKEDFIMNGENKVKPFSGNSFSAKYK
jgi:hypothetical protein